jgi:hypothetical protein
MPTLNRCCFASIIALLVGASPCTAQAATPVVLEQNGVRISLGATYKVHGQIKVDGIPFTDQSRLYALRPNSGGRFFGYEDDIHSAEDTKVTTGSDGVVHAAYPLRAPNGEFTGMQEFELTPDRVLRFQVDASFHKTGGNFEHRVGGIYTGWLSGRAFKAQLRDGSTTSGVLPTAPVSESAEQSTILKDFVVLEVQTAMGALMISTSGTLPLRLQDYRRNRYFDAEPLFWLGVSETPMKPDERVQFSVEMRFPPLAPPMNTMTAEYKLKPEAVPDAYVPGKAGDVIVPTPKKVTWGAGNLEFADERAAAIGGAFPAAEMFETIYALQDSIGAAASAQGAVKSTAGTSFSIANVAAKAPIMLRLQPATKADHLEHYHLKVAETVDLTAETTEGLVAGVQTLRQLVRPGGKPGSVAFRRCEIDDYATLPFRCIHFFAGAGDSPTHIKLLQQLLGPLKLNELCYHADNLVWESHPEIRNPAGRSMTFAEVRKVVDAAHKANVDVIPLVASFGHSEWMLTTPELRKLADNPDFPYAYDPTNPEVYKLVEELYTDAVKLFQPRYFHIGHDEVDLKGFPQQERLKKIGLTNLFANDVWHYRNWFAKRGIKMIIWGDMLVGPGESPDATLAPSVEIAKERRQSLPKDIIVGDWHYVSDPPETYKSLQILNESGFDTAAVTWMHPLNVTNFARAGALANETTATYTNPNHGRTLGILQSTWSGSRTNDEVIRKNSDQYACYVLAAEAGWNGGSMRPDQLPYDFRKYFSELWIKDMLPVRQTAGWKLELANLPVQLVSRFAGEGSRNLPASARFPIETTASLLMFDVAATTGGPADPPIATSSINYDDGTSQPIEWKIGYNVLGAEDRRSMPGAIITNADAPRGSYIHRYIVKAQTARIREITFTSANQGPGLIVHAITGVQ